ncbi:hypothetical protein AB1N83_008024 [Pleurotus pulmonarius]
MVDHNLFVRTKYRHEQDWGRRTCTAPLINDRGILLATAPLDERTSSSIPRGHNLLLYANINVVYMSHFGYVWPLRPSTQHGCSILRGVGYKCWSVDTIFPVRALR